MTHINAYYQDVEEAKSNLEKAKGELYSAEATLKAHPDYVAPKPIKVKEDAKPVKPSPKKKV